MNTQALSAKMTLQSRNAVPFLAQPAPRAWHSSSGGLRTRLALLLCLAAVSMRAELPLARLFTIFPPGGKAGSTVEVTVNGVDLDDPTLLLFSNSNVTGSPKAGDANKFLVTVSSNALPGIYDAR